MALRTGARGVATIGWKSAVGAVHFNSSCKSWLNSEILTAVEIDQCMDDFVSEDTEALRSHPRDKQAFHAAKKKEVMTKICDLTMQIIVL
jgi:hypothetical protein